MNQVVDHWKLDDSICVRVEGTEGPKHGRIAGGWASNHARKNNVRLKKSYVETSWTYGFLHRTDVYYRIVNK